MQAAPRTAPRIGDFEVDDITIFAVGRPETGDGGLLACEQEEIPPILLWFGECAVEGPRPGEPPG